MKSISLMISIEIGNEMSKPNDGRKTTNDYRRHMVDARDWRRKEMLPLLAESTPIYYENKERKMRDGIVQLAWTPCNFGGWRVWFICPKCERKISVIYTAYDLACRHCYDLKYASQGLNFTDRGYRRINKLRKRLGWAGGFAHGEFGKPKNMHWKTYCRLHKKYSVALRETLGSFKWPDLSKFK